MLKMSRDFMRDPAVILVPVKELSLECIRQFYVPILHEKDKFEVLINLFQTLGKATILEISKFQLCRNLSSHILLQFKKKSRIAYN